MPNDGRVKHGYFKKDRSSTESMRLYYQNEYPKSEQFRKRYGDVLGYLKSNADDPQFTITSSSLRFALGIHLYEAQALIRSLSSDGYIRSKDTNLIERRRKGQIIKYRIVRVRFTEE